MSSTRIKTIRFFALLAMILGGVLCVAVIYGGITSMFALGQRYGSSFVLHKHEMNRALYLMMGKTMLCQMLVGGGGFVRWKCRKLLEKQQPAA